MENVRGRARGRARRGGAQEGGPRPGGPQGAWAPRPAGPPQQQRAPQPGPAPQRPPQGAWGGRPQGPPQSAPQGPPQGASQPTAWGARPPAPEMQQMQSVGRGSRQAAGGDNRSVPTGAMQVSQGGDVASETRGGGNGGVRGRTNRNEILHTKPIHVQTKKGVDGKIIDLKANYFKLISATKWGLNQYRVDFNPELDDTKIRKRLVANGIRPFNVTGYLFDGTVLYTPNRLHPEPCEFTVSEDDASNAYRVTVRMVSEVQWGDWHYLQLFNIIIRKCFTHMQFDLLGRNYYDSKMKVSIEEHNLEIWPGFLTAMRQYEQDIMLNVDLSFKVLRQDRVYDLLMECNKGRNPKVEFQNKLIGCIVLTSYNNKTYRVDDVDFSRNPDSTFEKRDGSVISFREYFLQRYKVRVKVTDQPLLISKSKPREVRAGMPELVVLVPELCIMTGLSDKQRENFHLMKAMGEHTRVSAGDRMRKLLQFISRLSKCPQAVEEVRRWDLKLAEDLVSLQGRVLPPEPLVLAGHDPRGHIINGGEEADWTRNLRSAPLFNTVNIDSLAVLAPNRLGQDADEFCKMLQKVGRGMSLNIRYRIQGLQDDKSQGYLNELERIIGGGNAPSMVMCVLSNNSGDRYNAIKKKCYVDRAIPCQVMVARNLTSKGAMSIATKVAIQMNCKMGGAPWGTNMPRNTMVCGYDVCRDTANRKKSFGGMVATLDAACTRYFSTAIEHDQEQELSNYISMFLNLAIRRYREINKVVPERIIIYRDGVGEGQIPYVKDHEIKIIKEKLTEEYYREQPLKMAFIVVSKRINTKIFRSNPNQRNDFNPPPGTVVDDVITLPERYDFFLVSQCVRQGTVAPTSYNIIEDTLGIDANKIQRFTFKMCHMYFNWSGTVRVPAPCQYAHKLAFLTAQSLHRPAHAALQETLYYL